MRHKQPASLETKVATAKAVVDCLVSIGAGFESDEWMQKFRLVKSALDEGRLRDAIREELQSTSSWTASNWIVSGELAKTLEEAMAVLLRQLHYPDHSEPDLELGVLPHDVTVSGRTGHGSPPPVNDELRILGCRFRFRFQCPKTWEQLVPAGDSAIRHCETCDRDVFLCRNEPEWQEHSRANRCVALEAFERSIPEPLLGFPMFTELEGDEPNHV